MKTLLNKKFTIVLAATFLCVTIVQAQIPERLKDLPYFKQRALMLESLRKSHPPGKLNDMRCSYNALCLKAQTTLGGTGDDFGYTMIPTRDGGFMVCGGTNSADGNFKVPAANGGDAFIAKYNRFGKLEWTKTIGGTGEDHFTGIAQTFDGGYIASGQSISNDGDISGNHGGYDVLVVKFDAAGNVEWQKSLGGSGDEFGEGVIQTFYGGYAVTALTTSNDGDVSGNHNTDGDFDAWLVQLSPKGNLLWQRCYGGSSFDLFTSLVRSDIGNLIVQGYTASNDGDVSGNHGGNGGDAWVVKVNAFGKIIWQKCIGGSNNDDPSPSLVKTNDGNVVIGGVSQSTDGDINGSNDTANSFVTKLNSKTGAIIWSRSYAEPKYRGGFGLFATADGGTVETGAVGDDPNDGATFDVLVSKFNANGKQEWYKRLGGSNYDQGVSGYELLNGDLNIMSQTFSTDGDIKKSDGGADIWITQLGRCGNYIADNAALPDNAVASAKNNTISLSAYPNPVSNSATISFNLSQSQKISLIIYDMNGRLIKTLANEQMQAGNHQLTWNARGENAIAGTYLLKLQAENNVETKTISVVR